MSTVTRDCGAAHTTPSDREFEVTRVFDAPRRLVFDAWTRPEHLPNWLGPDGWSMSACEVDLRPGGGWRFGWRREDGTEMGMSGTYREVAPPDRLVSTEAWGGDWPETVNTLLLAEEGGRTRIAMRALYPSAQARDAALGTGMLTGIAKCFDRLAAHLRTMA